MSSELFFSDFLKTKGYLNKTSDGFEGYVNQNGTFEVSHYSREDIASVGPKVLAIVDEMFALVEQYMSGQPSIYAENIASTLSYWESPLKITNTSGNESHIGAIDGFTVCTDKPDEFELSVVVNDMHQNENGSFIKRIQWGTIRVSGTELDRHYPNWRVRYDLMTSLNVEHAELVKHVFEKPLTYQSQNISGITFE